METEVIREDEIIIPRNMKELIEAYHRVKIPKCVNRHDLDSYVLFQINTLNGMTLPTDIELHIQPRTIKDELLELHYLEVENDVKGEKVMLNAEVYGKRELTDLHDFINLEKPFKKNLDEKSSIDFVYYSAMLRYNRVFQEFELLGFFEWCLEDASEGICALEFESLEDVLKRKIGGK